MARKPESKPESKPVSFEAKVKRSETTNIVIAFAGKEFVKYEWRKVPTDPKSIVQAKKHPMLEIRAVQKRASKEPPPVVDKKDSDK